MVTSLRDRPSGSPGAIGEGSVDASFDDVAEDLDEVAWLAGDVASRARRRQREVIRHHRHLEGESIDDLERHLRAVTMTCDAIRREAESRALDARRSARSVETLAWLTRDRARLADRVRTLAGIAASACVAMEWQSPSFDHAVRSNAGTRLGRVRAHHDDYRRDRHPDAAAYEEAYLRAVVAPPPGLELRALATACGMAAVTTAIAFLRKAGALDGAVVLGASAYHENRELVRDVVPPERLVEVDDRSPGPLVRAIETVAPSAVVLDTLANAPGVAVADVDAVAGAIARVAPDAVLVLDNTGRSCAFRPFDVVAGRARTVVVESLTKFPQFGLDRVTAGVVVAAAADAAILDDLREHLGTNVPDVVVAALPTPDAARLGRRLGRIGRNAGILARRLAAAIDRTSCGPVTGVAHPSLGDPPPPVFAGGWCTLRFAPGRDDPAEHRRFVDRALDVARRRRVPLVAGASFGLDVTRVYPIASSATAAVPFVRISAGIEHRAGIERVAEVLVEAARSM